MPPAQCPECARFLSKAFVASLGEADAPCPKCETILTASMFGEPPVDGTTSAGADERSTAAVDDTSSVRPSDGSVRSPDGPDVLRGWDTGGAPVSTITDPDRGPGPSAPCLAVFAASGAIAGGLIARLVRGGGAVQAVGAALGAVAGAAAAQATGGCGQKP